VTFERALELVLGNLGVLVLLLLILVGGYRKMWCWGWYVDELHGRILRLERQLDRSTGIAESGTGLAREATRHLAERRDSDGADT
jgi:hypothetical protein